MFTTVLSLLLVIIFKQPYKRINEETMQQSAVINSQMIESLRGIETVKCNATLNAMLVKTDLMVDASE